MSQHIRKIVNLKDINFSWILFLSFTLFGLSCYIDRLYSNDPIWIHGCYWLSFTLAVLWGALNYISQIRMNNMYKKQNDIQQYVNQLAMSEEDQLELQTYLEDFVQDLIEQGKTKEDATREAINQFKVKEFLSLSKNTMFFNLHAHYYLIGWTTIILVSFILVWLLGIMVFPNLVIILTIEVTLFAYGIGLFGMFFVYKVIDAIIYRKFKELF